VTTGAVDVVVLLAHLRQSFVRRRAGARDRAAQYGRQKEMWASQKFAEGQALAYDQAIRAVDDAIGALDDPKEVTKLNGS